MTILEILKQECIEVQGQFVLTIENRVLRLVGLASDAEDVYYLLYDGEKVTWLSAVCGFVPLKKYLPEGHYCKMVQIAKRNEVFMFLEGLQLEEYVKSLVNLKENENFIVPLKLTIN